MGDLTKNFSRGEFACHDGTPWPVEREDALLALAEACQKIRDAWGGPLIVVSAYRPLAYNRWVGSTDTSQHTGPNEAKTTPPCAVDLRPMDRLGAHREARARLLHAEVLRLIRDGEIQQGGVGVYPRSGFVHYDQRCLYGYRAARWAQKA